MTVQARVVSRRDEWNAIVLGMPRPDFRQSWQWGAVRASHGWEAVRIAVVDGGTHPVAAQVLARRVRGLGVLLYAPRGPLVAEGEAGWDALPHLLQRIQAETGGIFLRVSPGVASQDAAALAPLQARGFARLADLWSLWNTPRNVMRLDLTGSERDVLARMARKRRQHVSTGARKGVTTELATSLAALRAFHELHGAHGQRQGYLVPPWSALETLYHEFAVDGGLTIVSGRVNGELAGMLVGLRFGAVAHTLYAASTPAAHRAPVGDLLHWDVMRWARAAGCRELDLGSSCTDVPPTESHPNYGIYRFKCELGARLELCAGYYDHVFTGLRYHLARQLELVALRLGQRRLGRLPLVLVGRRDPVAQSPTPVAQAS